MQVIPIMPGDCDKPRLRIVSKLSVAATSPDDGPAVIAKNAEDLSNTHFTSQSTRLLLVKLDSVTMPNRDELLAVMREARRLVMLPGNDFSWSSWEDSAAAAGEIDGILGELAGDSAGAYGTMGVIFAPTGPMQELSLSSGWSAEFLALADRFDAAMADPQCGCLEEPLRFVAPFRELGMDERFAEVSLLRCPACGRAWVRYHCEEEAYSGSGRWYLGQVEVASAAEARGALEGLPRYLFGGNYFDGRTGWGSGPLA